MTLIYPSNKTLFLITGKVDKREEKNTVYILFTVLTCVELRLQIETHMYYLKTHILTKTISTDEPYSPKSSKEF